MKTSKYFHCSQHHGRMARGSNQDRSFWYFIMRRTSLEHFLDILFPVFSAKMRLWFLILVKRQIQFANRERIFFCWCQCFGLIQTCLKTKAVRLVNVTKPSSVREQKKNQTVNRKHSTIGILKTMRYHHHQLQKLQNHFLY